MKFLHYLACVANRTRKYHSAAIETAQRNIARMSDKEIAARSCELRTLENMQHSLARTAQARNRGVGRQPAASV